MALGLLRNAALLTTILQDTAVAITLPTVAQQEQSRRSRQSQEALRFFAGFGI